MRNWLVVTIIASTSLSGCSLLEQCEPEAVKEFRSLPPMPGVEFEVSTDHRMGGCFGTVPTPNGGAVLAHYEEAMRDAGWEVSASGSNIDGEVSGRGPVAFVQLMAAVSSVSAFIAPSDEVDAPSDEVDK